MKNLQSLAILITSFSLLFTACNKDDNFCISNISVKTIASIGEAAFTLPNGQSYSGLGALPNSATIGNYKGNLQSVVTKQTPTATGMEMELVHYFDDGKGNAFWTSDKATFTPLDTTFTRFQVHDIMTIVDGTGDFKCASGQLINEGPANFATSKLEVNIRGNVCGGCD